MGWKAVLFAFAAVTALALGARGEVASAPPQPLQPRYATQIPPGQDDAQIDAAPSATVQAAPAVAPATDDAAAKPQPQQTSAAPEPQRRIEQITVTGLRPSEDGLYRLGPGDRLRVTVFNEGDLSGEFSIDGQGFVRLPLIGAVLAAGLSTYGLESRIAAALMGGGFLISPRVAVEVTTYRPFYIMGEVAKPGEYPYVNAMTVPNAVALAGGYTERAMESAVWVRRQGESQDRELPADQTTRIYPGDVIRVKRTAYWSMMTVLEPLFSPAMTLIYILK